MSERDREKGAQLRAERIQKKVRSRGMNEASRNMGERLRKMNDQSNSLDKRLSRHAEEGQRWHRIWDDPARRN